MYFLHGNSILIYSCQEFLLHCVLIIAEIDVLFYTQFVAAIPTALYVLIEKTYVLNVKKAFSFRLMMLVPITALREIQNFLLVPS